jgi:RsiW-degrading membrane proteinase PrsW (M82 family)
MGFFLLLTVSVFAGFLPMLCWAALVWWADRYEKEPVSLLAMAFLWGVAPAVGFSILLEMILLPSIAGTGSSDPTSAFTLLSAGGWAPWIEEGVKLLGLVGLFMVARHELDGPMDGVVYASMIGFGFAATENTLYFLSSNGMPDFFLLFFLRAMLFGAAHAMFTAFSAWGLVMALSAKRPWQSILWASAGFLLAVGLHWFHNTGIQQLAESVWPFLLSVALNLTGVGFIVLLICGALIRERSIIRKYLYPYVRADVLSLDQWRSACSIRGRILEEWRAVSQMDLRTYWRISAFYSTCAELAFKEKQRAQHGPNPNLDGRIFFLRKRLVELIF